MKQLPSIPECAPFSATQRAWLNGYLAAWLHDASLSATFIPAQQTHATGKRPSLLVMYGSQTGTAESIAKRLAKQSEERGFAPRVLELNAYASVDWDKEERFVLVTSTWGDGDPPDNARAFWEHLNSDPAPEFHNLAYAVLALGDRNYPEFCGAGKKFDMRLAQLGAKRICPRTDCDVEYEATANEWTNELWKALEEMASGADASTNAGAPAVNGASQVATALGNEKEGEAAYSRQNPFPSRILRNRILNGTGFEKEIRHVELSLEDSGLSYEVGDALGVIPTNCPELVEEILRALGCDGDEEVSDSGGHLTALRQALLRSYQITQAPPALIGAVAERGEDKSLGRLLSPENKAELENYLYGREIIDLLLEFPKARFAPAEFVGCLRKLQPRLYSISSSLKAHPGEVHLTVGIVRYETHGRGRKGVCSTFLADRTGGAISIPIFVQTAHGFRLPADSSIPIIMIGPGTGIAPFRAFLQERRAMGATGPTWLFFGAQRCASDFLYREELESMRDEGTLTRLETAFSRDQPEKIYVQHRMLQNAGEVWRWLESGAYIYVCGDAKRMAKDVDAALRKVVELEGGRTTEQASDYVQSLKTEKRYRRDVY